MPSLTRWSDEQVACLREHWRRGSPMEVIRNTLEIGIPAIRAKAAELGLGPAPPPKVTRGARIAYRGLGPELRHRRALGFHDPVRLAPPASPVGAAIRSLDDATRALIDAALAARGMA